MQESNKEITIQNVISKKKEISKRVDNKIIMKAYNYAVEHHGDQKRHSGEPYIIHPLNVAYILAEVGLDEATICAALLHDVVEDTDVTDADLRRDFSDEIADMVAGVTKLGSMMFSTVEEQQVEDYRKMFLAMGKDIRVIIIKLADRLHNMRTLKFLRRDRQIANSKETMEIYAPLANRLGLYSMKWELEDLAFKYLYPEEYHELVEGINKKREERLKFIEKIMDNIRVDLKKQHIDAEVTGRAKHLYSIYRKMQRDNKTLDQIYDLFALRILVNSVKDCYAALGIVHELYSPMPGRFKDYIAVPKPNMYQSIHTTLLGEKGTPFEVQIRTWDMHRIAEYGIAAHWAYKENRQVTAKQEQKEIQDKLKWYETLIAYQEEVNDAEKLMKLVKDDIFNANVYVFTPNGDVFDFPPGSTPIDFAYRIHTNLGHKTTGAIVNGKIVTLNYQLKTGDIVEIKSSRNSFGPSEDWLNIVKTSQARHKIRQYFNRTKREEYTRKGEESFSKELASKDLSINSIDIQKLLKIYKKQNVDKLEELYYQIGRGRLVPKTILERYLSDGKEVNETDLIQQINDAAKVKEGQRKKAKNRFGIIVDGLDNVDLRIAKCCNPVPGDPIVGYITKGSGITIHHAECHNAKMDGRLVPVEWDDEHQNTFNAKIKVVALDRKNVLGDIIQRLATINTNITELNAQASADTVIINMSFSVRNIEQLLSIVNTIKRVKDVFSVERILQ